MSNSNMQLISRKNTYGRTTHIVRLAGVEKVTNKQLLEFCNYCEPLGGEVRKIYDNNDYEVTTYTN